MALRGRGDGPDWLDDWLDAETLRKFGYEVNPETVKDLPYYVRLRGRMIVAARQEITALHLKNGAMAVVEVGT